MSYFDRWGHGQLLLLMSFLSVVTDATGQSLFAAHQVISIDLCHAHLEFSIESVLLLYICNT